MSRRLHFIFNSDRFTGGRAVLGEHAAQLAAGGWEVNAWTLETSHGIDLKPIAAGQEIAGLVRVGPWMGWEKLPAADAIIVERPSLVLPAMRHARGAKVIQFVQGYEGDEVQRLWEVARAKRTFAGWWEARKWHKRLRMIQQAYEQPTIKLVVHEHLRRLIAERYQQQAMLVPNGLPAGIFTATENRQWSGWRVLVVGPTDTPSKQVIDALEAMKILKQQGDDLKLVRVAQHDMRPAEQAMGVTDEYHTMLNAVAMARVYQGCDVLLLPYNSAEGFGLPAVEAMACGLPAVLTDIPAFRTFDEPADYASFVPVGDAGAMARAVKELLDDPAMRQRRSARGLAVAGRYTQQASQQAMAEVLQRVLK